MQDKLISAVKLYEAESLLMTDSVKQDPVANNLLHQVLYDIENTPGVYVNDDFADWLKERNKAAKQNWYDTENKEDYGKMKAYMDVLTYLRSHEVIK